MCVLYCVLFLLPLFERNGIIFGERAHLKRRTATFILLQVVSNMNRKFYLKFQAPKNCHMLWASVSLAHAANGNSRTATGVRARAHTHTQFHWVTEWKGCIIFQINFDFRCACRFFLARSLSLYSSHPFSPKLCTWLLHYGGWASIAIRISTTHAFGFVGRAEKFSTLFAAHILFKWHRKNNRERFVFRRRCEEDTLLFLSDDASVLSSVIHSRSIYERAGTVYTG